MNSPSSPSEPSNRRSENSRDTQNAAPSQPERAVESRRSILLVILGICLLVAVPILAQNFSAESARWRVAAVYERYLDGEHKQSITELRQLAEKLPGNDLVKMTLAKWLLQDRNAEEALQVLESIPETKQKEKFLSLKIGCLIGSGDCSEALRVYREAHPANEVRANAWKVLQHKNTLAYLSALAGEDIELALENANTNIAYHEQGYEGELEFKMRAPEQALFYAAIIYRDKAQRVELSQAERDEAADKALEITSAHINWVRESYFASCEDKRKLVGQRGDDEEPENESTEQSEGEKKAKANELKRNYFASTLSAFCTLRALVYQDLGKYRKSREDRKFITSLAFRPEQVANRFPDVKSAAWRLQALAGPLDTRGCVRYRMGKIALAILDLNAAIVAQQATIDISAYFDRTSIQLEDSLDPRQQEEAYVRLPQRSLAVMLLHRSWAWEAMLQLQLRSSNGAPADIAAFRRADKDRARIRELGFQPDRYLF